MLVFDVKCDVTQPVHVKDSNANDVTIPPGHYRLQGIDHIVRTATGGASVDGMDIAIVSLADRNVAFRVPADELSHFIALRQVEVTI